jgi:hypothetical protein
MMGLLGFLKRGRGDDAARAWRRACERAIDTLDAAAPARLAADLPGLAPPGGDVEVEAEMLQALGDVLALERDLAAGALPAIETAHRVAAGERCHYSAPVSMPDDPAQPTGRLLLTSGRAAFAGGARTAPLPWHGLRQVVRAERDLIFVRAGDEGVRFRCNSFSDAACGAALARCLMRAARKPL